MLFTAAVAIEYNLTKSQFNAVTHSFGYNGWFSLTRFLFILLLFFSCTAGSLVTSNCTQHFGYCDSNNKNYSKCVTFLYMMISLFVLLLWQCAPLIDCDYRPGSPLNVYVVRWLKIKTTEWMCIDQMIFQRKIYPNLPLFVWCVFRSKNLT